MQPCGRRSTTSPTGRCSSSLLHSTHACATGFSDDAVARRSAELRLDRCLGRLEAAGIRAEGLVGDADPVQAIDDALRPFPADRLVVATHPEGRSNWLARDLVVRAARFGLPIAHIVADTETRPDHAATSWLENVAA
jgi:hypothetical protein